MLRYVAKTCTDALIKRKVVPCEKEKIYIYGFELLWSFTICIMCMIILSSAFGYFEDLIIFLLFFIPIRIVAGGYHAKTYGSCFLLTNLIAIGSVFLSRRIWKWNIRNIRIILWCVLIVSVFYIWNNAPVITNGHSLKPELLRRNRKYSWVILGIELIVIALINVISDNCLVYTSIVTSCVVAILIRISKKGAE